MRSNGSRRPDVASYQKCEDCRFTIKGQGRDRRRKGVVLCRPTANDSMVTSWQHV